ncbi:fumarate hydratase C-terminal domain-containing protein [bacterium]|nr:fumarate hydratase C-terminal domain-containing protein [bacterium]
MKKIIIPAEREALYSLTEGEEILLSGRCYTMRDSACKRLCISGSLPFEMRNEMLFFAGPSPARPGEIIGSCGPTTSARMEPFFEFFLSKGVSGMIGKGPISKEAISLLAKYKAVYLIGIGGAAAYLSQFIKEATIIAYPELGTEAIHRLILSDLPLYVSSDISLPDNQNIER